MPENFEQNKARNAELLGGAQFALQNRREPNITVMSVSDYGLRNELVERLKEKLPEYRFYDIDLTPHKVVSLRQSLQKLLPAEVLDSPPITYCVNVFGLENSRLTSEDGQIVDSGMIAQLNYEREIVFRKPNYLTILWGDRDFFVQLQRQAPDFWSWVTYFFEFKQEEPYEEIVFEKELVPEFSARLPEREEYIKSLETKLERLPLNGSDKSRTTRERINLYSLLAEEYANYFDYENAKKYFENALRLYDQLGISQRKTDKILFDFATLNLRFRHFKEALSIYKKVLSNTIDRNDFENIGGVYHQIGRVYQEQRQWTQALEKYNEAIAWHEKTGRERETGSTYHQIGIIYEERQQWTQALENYGEALVWYMKTKQELRFGATYHQIGMVYEGQQRWSLALKNYQEALTWYKKMGQEEAFGGTYHHIGIVYEGQHQWASALESYGEAMAWYKKTGQHHQLGGTYHQIGRVFEEQKQWLQALVNYGEALVWYKKTDQEHWIGSTYHQIGMVHEKQHEWVQAMENYGYALSWDKKTNQEQRIAATYHQIGRVFEEQNNLDQALKMFEKASQATFEYQENEQAIIKDSLQCVMNKMAEKAPS